MKLVITLEVEGVDQKLFPDADIIADMCLSDDCDMLQEYVGCDGELDRDAWWSRDCAEWVDE